MLWTILCLFALAPVAPAVARVLPQAAGWLLSLVPLGVTGYFLGRLSEVRAGQAVIESVPWVAQLGLELSFALDGLSLLFALLICGVGALIFIYAGGYLEEHPLRGRMFGFLALFMASMLGLVLAENLLLLFVFWELTSISSYFLIGFDHEKENARGAALQALLVTGLGGLALMAGVLLLSQAGGSFSIQSLIAAADQVRGHNLYLPALLLILLGAFTKSAQFPFHFWLPAAMAAPTPVSAYLHSVTMVKAGVYLLFRLTPVLGGTLAWHGLLEGVGAVTMLLGAWLALVQTDLKRILAYTTISSLGTMVFLIGLDLPFALEAALVYLLAHALYKGALFLMAGAVDHATGSRDVTRLGGLFSHLPLLGLAAVAAALSMAGAPPLIGFLAKELLYKVSLMPPSATVAGGIAAVLASMLMVAAALLVVLRPFFGRPDAQLAHPHALPASLWLGPVVLALAGLAGGLLPGLAELYLLAPAAGAFHGGPRPLDLKLWHGFNLVLLLSAATLGCGILLYAQRARLRSLAERWRALAGWGPGRGYDGALHGLKTVAAWQTRVLQNGYLRIYLLTMVATTVALVALALFWRAGLQLAPGGVAILPRDVVVAGVILAAAWTTVRSGQRLAAIVAMGVIGYGVALIYVQFGAPDLAMTQFIIETMTVVLFALIFHRLPLFSRLRPGRSVLLDMFVAGSAGAMMTVLALVAITERQGSRLSGFFAEYSQPLAHGRNVVNVILVDFRALDTLGEIIVLALAGVGVMALLKLNPNGKDNP